MHTLALESALIFLSNGVFTRSSKRPAPLWAYNIMAANVQQLTCILNTFAGSSLDVCWIV